MENATTLAPLTLASGADPGFLEKGFSCVKEGVRYAGFSSVFLNIPSK